jgi:uncharacterized membrane protein (UPF0127 family)
MISKTILINKYPFDLYVALTDYEIQKGLMFVKELNENLGMIFIFDEPQIKNFWMKNTFIPLDILFINEHCQIVKIHKCANPLDETMISSETSVKYVIELKCGIVDKYNIKIGDTISSN